jgi:hypothetical protein
MAITVFAGVVEYSTWPPLAKACAERAALSRPELLDALARNPFISEETWFALYTAKPLPPAARASCLVRRPLSQAQIDWVTSVESRSTVFEDILKYYEINSTGQQRLASGKGLSQTTARCLIDADWVSDEVRETAARRAKGVALLRWLIRVPVEQCSTTEGAKLVLAFNSWIGKTIPRRMAMELVDRRPDLIPAIIAYGPGHFLYGTALASRRFTSDALATVAIAGIANRAKAAKAKLIAAQAGVESTDRGNVRRFDMLLVHYENQMANLIENPAVSPERAHQAKDAVAEFTVNTSGNSAERAWYRRSKDQPGGYDAMSGALREPYETISDPTVLRYLLSKLALQNNGLALASLGVNPNLGKLADEVANRLRFGLGWDLSSTERSAVISRFCELYPHLGDQFLGGVVMPKQHDWPVPAAPDPMYVTEVQRQGEPMIVPGHASATMPKRYRLSLKLLGALPREAYCGVGAYVAHRLGDNATAWQTLFALADELQTGDLDTLIDTALALSQ